RAPGRSVPPGSARPLPTAPGGHPVRQSSAAGSTPCGRLAALATPHARTPTAAANVLPADWAHVLRPPRRTDTSLAASWPGLFASRGTLVCLRAAITVCADTCHASSGPHRPLLRYNSYKVSSPAGGVSRHSLRPPGTCTVYLHNDRNTSDISSQNQIPSADASRRLTEPPPSPIAPAVLLAGAHRNLQPSTTR